MPIDQKIDYLELPASDFDQVQSFYEKVLAGVLLTTALNTEPSQTGAWTAAFTGHH